MSIFVPSQRLVLDDSITTGQGVALEITPASPLQRIAAAVIDVAVTFLWALIIALFTVEYLDSASASMLRVYGTLAALSIMLFVPLTIETLTRGRSLGKWALNLQVVRDDGGVVTFHHSLMRTVTGLFETWVSFGSVAVLTTILHPRAKRLGDVAAGTTVIHLPEPMPYHALIMPPDAAQWASTAQVVRLPAALVTRALMFMRDLSTLQPYVRQGVAVEIANELARFVEPTPPASLHPERFIAAVLVLNRDRDVVKLDRWERAAVQARGRSNTEIFDIR